MSALIDLSGKRFGSLVAIGRAEKPNPGKAAYWFCRCDCGLERAINGQHLRTGKTTSCGCSKASKVQPGQVYGYLTVLRQVESDGSGHRRYACRCHCGKETVVSTGNLVASWRRSCGCQTRAERPKRDASPVWVGYEEIGGTIWAQWRLGAQRRGIPWEITKEHVWEVFLSQGRRCVYTGVILFFPEKPRDRAANVSLDRVDSAKGYIPGNVQLVQKRVNMMKSDLTEGDFLGLVNSIYAHSTEGTKER